MSGMNDISDRPGMTHSNQALGPWSRVQIPMSRPAKDDRALARMLGIALLFGFGMLGLLIWLVVKMTTG